VESFLLSTSVTFEALRARLIVFVNNRIQKGDITERGLARILGISQPQLHNVLKGARRLQPEIADRLMRKFSISILDLLEDAEIVAEAQMRPRWVKERVIASNQHIPSDVSVSLSGRVSAPA
jgi:transcriptional regulator with XRE-family HTH domain